MHIIPFLERGHSGTSDMNLLFNDGACYIMDNHLAAAWCWLQKINTGQQYNLLHIDRHYDLLSSQIAWWVEDLRNQQVDISQINFDQYRRLMYQTRFGAPDQSYRIFRWDNYLTIFNQLYPNLIQTALFATHKDGDTSEDLDISEKEPWDLHNNLSYWMTNGNPHK